MIAVLLASGAAVGLLIGAILLAGYFGGPPERDTAAKRAAASGKPGDVTPVVPVSIPSPPVAAPAKPLPNKVLLVIPRHGLWYADYAYVKQTLDAEKIDVVVASSEIAASSTFAGSDPGLVWPDVVLDKSLNVDDFGAIIFVGYDTTEYHPGPGIGDCVGRYIAAFRDRGRLVTAICAGQRVLAAHGALRGKTVAHSNHTDQIKGYTNSGARPVRTRVERDGQIITAATETDARAFVEEIAAALKGS
jgi:putative intracellular protease/amidase